MRLTSAQLRNIIAEEIQSEAARPRPGDDLDISGLDAPALRRLKTRVDAALRDAEAASTVERTAGRLVPVDVVTSYAEDGVYVPPSVEKRFRGGFFQEKTSTGKLRGFFAKTATGVLYRFNPARNSWEKFEG